MNADAINAELRSLYDLHWPALLTSIPRSQGYSAPLLLHVKPDYAEADVRLMVVGQQTNTWWGADGWDKLRGEQDEQNRIGYLLERYSEFDLGARYPGPFWSAARSLARSLGSDNKRCALIWSNLNRVDRAQSKKDPDARASKEIEDALRHMPLLEGEIAILKPNVVVFFTGPNYDDRLVATFPGVKYGPVNGQERWLSVLEHRALPRASFRTYHPGYLQRKRLLQPILDEITKTAVGRI